MNDRRYVSPDGELCLLVISPDGDLTIGFEGYPWHTHGDVLVREFGGDAGHATERFIVGIVESQFIIAMQRTGGRVEDVWVLDRNESSLQETVAGTKRYGAPGEIVEFRLWDGTRIPAPAG